MAATNKSRSELVDEFVSRAYDDFPAGPECSFDIDDFPDTEDECGVTSHYVDESRQRTNPPVTDDIVTELLTDGVVRESFIEDCDNKYLLQKEIGGHEWTLVVADDKDHEFTDNRWVLITIYSNYHGSQGTTNRYLDRLSERRGDD